MVARALLRIDARDDTGRAFRSAADNIHDLDESLEGAAASGQQASLGLGSLAKLTAGAGAAALGALAVSAISSARELEQLGNIAGVSGSHLDLLGKVAQTSGGSAEDVADAFREMQLRLSEATQLASGPAVDALRLLGLSADDLAHLPAVEQFDLLRDRISAVVDPADRLFAAEELLGGSSERLAAIIGPTAAEFDSLTDAMVESGRVMGDQTIQRLADASRSIDEMKDQLTILVGEGLAVAIDAFEASIPAINAFIDTLLEIGGAVEEIVGSFASFDPRDWAQGIVAAVTPAAEEMTNLQRLTAEVGEEAARSIMDSTDAVVVQANILADFRHRQATDIRAYQSFLATADRLRTSREAAESQARVTTRRKETEAKIALARREASTVAAPGFGRLQLAQLAQGLPGVLLDVRQHLAGVGGGGGGGGGYGGGRSTAEEVEEGTAAALGVELVPRLDDYLHLSGEQALAQIRAASDAYRLAADADAHRSLAEQQIIDRFDRLIGEVQRLAQIEDDAAAADAAEGPVSRSAEALAERIASGVTADGLGGTRYRTGRYDDRTRALAEHNLAQGIGVSFLGSGGIVTRPTAAVIGEAGPEAVIPLDRLGSGQQTVHVTIELDGQVLGDAVLDRVNTGLRSGEVSAVAELV